MKKRVFPLLLMLSVLLSACAARPVSCQSFALDTVITVTVYRGGGEEEAREALRCVDECESRYSAHREGSDISRANAAESGKGVEVDERTAGIVAKALEIGEKTDGALDITLYAVSALWDYKSEDPQVPEEEQIREALARSGRERVRVEGNLLYPGGTQLDLGAVAKGAAADEAAQCLREQGVTSALLNLGGNIETLGEKPDGSPWIIAIDSPFGEGLLGSFELEGEGAVATSSGAQRYFEKDGKRYHHILDPKTGAPAQSGLASVTVVAEDGLTADALSTALFVLGPERAREILQEEYPEVSAVLVEEDGSICVVGDLLFTPEKD